MSETATCDTCNHQAHGPGQCKSCNCGHGDISNLSGTRRLTVLPSDRGLAGSSLGLRGYDRGHRVRHKGTDSD